MEAARIDLASRQARTTRRSIVFAGAYAEAEPMLKRALSIREKALVPDQLDFAKALHAAKVHCGQGRYKDAEPLVVGVFWQSERRLWDPIIHQPNP
jgi:hypothetical protein